MAHDELKAKIRAAIAELTAEGKRVSKSAVYELTKGNWPTVRTLYDEVMGEPDHEPDQPGPTPPAAAAAVVADRMAQAAAHLAITQEQLAHARQTMVDCLTILAGLELPVFTLSGLRLEDDPDLVAHRQAAHAAVETYREARAAVTQAEADLAAVQQAACGRQTAQVATRREAWLRQHDPEYRELLEDIARYTRRVAETDNIETLRDHRAAQYQLREANKRRAEKLAAASAA
jgi:hypothetical protein